VLQAFLKPPDVFLRTSEAFQEISNFAELFDSCVGFCAIFPEVRIAKFKFNYLEALFLF